MSLRAIAGVLRGEGAASAIRRVSERMSEALVRARRTFAPRAGAAIVNVGSIARRTGGVAVQLAARLEEERALRNVALVDQLDDVRNALEVTGARAVQLDGTSGVPVAQVLRLMDAGIDVIVSLHDFTLHSNPLAPRLLADARAVIAPSRFLLNAYRDAYALPFTNAEIIEPSAPRCDVAPNRGSGVAFAGSVKPHKGGALLPDIAALLAPREMTLRVFGGGDVALLRRLRRYANVVVHGYYRSGTLPALLARHGIGLVLIPSLVPESYAMTLSEAWCAGAVAAAFDLGAQAARIREHGGGWIAPLESGAVGMVAIIDRWRGSGASMPVPPVTASPAAAARAHVDLYRRLRLLP